MVTYCATKLTATCFPMIGQFVDTMKLASSSEYRVVIMTHQILSLEKYWKLFSATSINKNKNFLSDRKKRYN